jgi:hypothetical protein
LSPQAVQRVGAYLRSLTFDSARVDRVADAVAADVNKVLNWGDAENRVRADQASRIEDEIARLESVVEQSASKRWWRRRRNPTASDPEAEINKRRQEIPQPVPTQKLRASWQALIDADYSGVWDE